jgi:hypothetical protein
MGEGHRVSLCKPRTKPLLSLRQPSSPIRLFFSPLQAGLPWVRSHRRPKMGIILTPTQHRRSKREDDVPEIYPKITQEKLKRSARTTSEGRGRAPLPGVKTDAKHVKATDKCGYEANRKIAKLIEKAMRTIKKTDKNGQHFVLGWRLYPYKKHSRWNAKDVHSCGCGCGCSA